MPLYMDVHRLLRAVTQQGIEQAHARDLEVQSKHGVKFLKYWVDLESGFMFCLVEAPNKEATFDVHREAHGLLADEIYEVREGS
jgi:hypothetical protein